MTFPVTTHRNLYRNMAATFDGTNDYMARGADLTGIADGKTATYSFWVKFNGGDGANQALIGSNSTVANWRNGIFRRTTNLLGVSGRNAAGTSILNLSSSVTVYADGLWHHVLVSYDLAASVAYVYLDDADVTTITTLTNDTIDFTTGNLFIGADNTAAAKLNADLSAFWFDHTYLNIAQVGNRRKFIDGGRMPVYLGANGERPLGSSPLLYQKVSLGGAASDFATNQGTGGNFTITGALALATGPAG